MKRGLWILLFIIMISMIMPGITLIETLTKTPEAKWSNEIDLVTLKDYTMRKFYPVKLLKLQDDEIIGVYIESGSLHVQRYSLMGKVIEDKVFNIGAKEVWQLQVEALDDDVISIYFKDDKAINYCEYTYSKQHLSSIKTIAFNPRGLSASGAYAIAYNDKAVKLFSRGEYILDLALGEVIDIKCKEDKGMLHIIYSYRDGSGSGGRYTYYDLDTKNYKKSINIYNAETSEAFGVIRDMVITDKGVGAVYSKTIVQQQTPLGVIAGIFIQGNQVVLNKNYKAQDIQPTVMINDANANEIAFISLLQSSNGVDFFKWNTTEGPHSGFQLTNTRQTGILPHAFTLNHKAYFYWLDLSVEGKLLRMSSEDDDVIKLSRVPSFTDYLALPFVLIFTGFIPVLITFFIPIYCIDIALVFFLSTFYKKAKAKQNVQRAIIILFTFIHIVYLSYAYLKVMLPQYINLDLSPLFVKNSVLSLLLFIIILVISYFIAKVFTAELIGEVWVYWYGYFTLCSALLVCVNYGLYRAIDIMKFKF